MTRLVVALLTFVLVSLSANQVLAVQNTLATANQAVLGEVQNVGVDGLASMYFRYNLTAGRSYAAFCWAASIQSNAPLSCTVSIRDGGDGIVGTTRASNQLHPEEPFKRSLRAVPPPFTFA